MTAKKRPSVIVMKRLDTMGLRLLSQMAGRGTRKAGVRLSPSGQLTPHRRGEPISDAPTADALLGSGSAEAEDDAATDGAPGAPVQASTVDDPTQVIPKEVRAFARARLAEAIALERAKVKVVDRRAASRGARAPSTDGPTAGVTLEATPPRRSLATWGLVLVVGGVLAGLGIARAVTDAAIASAPIPPSAAVAEAAGGPGDDTAAAPRVAKAAASPQRDAERAPRGDVRSVAPDPTIADGGLQVSDAKPSDARTGHTPADPRAADKGREASTADGRGATARDGRASTEAPAAARRGDGATKDATSARRPRRRDDVAAAAAAVDAKQADDADDPSAYSARGQEQLGDTL